MSKPRQASTPNARGWMSDSELVREFARPVDVTDAVVSTVQEATDKWQDLSERPLLSDFVDAKKLDGLFKTKAVDDSQWLPSAEFRFQCCRVTVLYGREIRVIIQRDR